MLPMQKIAPRKPYNLESELNGAKFILTLHPSLSNVVYNTIKDMRTCFFYGIAIAYFW